MKGCVESVDIDGVGGSAVSVDRVTTRVGAVSTLAQLYSASYGDMVRLAGLLTGAPAVAPDLVQDAFVQLHRRWGDVREPAAYLRRVVVNNCNSWHRRRFMERDRLPKVAVSEAIEQPHDELHDVLLKLSYRKRAAVVLRYRYGLDDAEIGGVLGVRPATVRSLLHRAVAELREVIER